MGPKRVTRRTNRDESTKPSQGKKMRAGKKEKGGAWERVGAFNGLRGLAFKNMAAVEARSGSGPPVMVHRQLSPGRGMEKKVGGQCTFPPSSGGEGSGKNGSKWSRRAVYPF